MKKEFQIGEVFQFGLFMLKVKKPEIGLCRGCIFNSGFYDCDSITDFTGSCSCCEREDKTSVIFAKID